MTLLKITHQKLAIITTKVKIRLFATAYKI